MLRNNTPARIVFLVALSCSATALSQQDPQPQIKSSKLGKDKSPTQPTPAANFPTSQEITNAIAAGIERANEKRETNHHAPPPDNSGWWFNCFLVIFTGLLVVVGGVNCYLIFWTLKATETAAKAAKKSADAATDQVSLSREALITTERAFIYCERIDAIWTADKKTELVTKWTFHPIWKNNGETPTKMAVNKISWWVGINAGDISPNFDFTNADDPGRTMIGPHATMLGSGLNITVEALQKMREGRGHAYLWGWFDYDDIFANTERHRTEFCLEIQVTGNPVYKNGGFAYRMHGPFNGFDEECYCKPRPYK